MTQAHEERLCELIEINEDAIRRHVFEHDIELSEDDLRDEAARAALEQLHDENGRLADVDNTKELKHLSLCTGYGGIDIGLKRALGAVRSVAYVEIEAFCVENLVAKIEGGWLDPAPICTNLKTFPFRAFRGRVDILSGGFPCQPFSSAGRRGGDEDPRHLWPHIVRGIRDLGRPPIVFFENVEGIISSKIKSDEWADPVDTPVLLHVLRELERLGYSASAGVFSAREVGAPHQRKRVFIMGVRSDLGESGRALISGMLERGTRGADMEHTTGEGLEGPPGASAQGRGVRPTGTGTAYPAPRGEDVENASSERAPSMRIVHVPSTHEPARADQLETHVSSGAIYPSPRGAEQHAWEPPRVTVGNADEPRLQGTLPPMDPREPRSPNARVSSTRSGAHGNIQGQTQPPMGRDVDGASRRLGYAELCRSVDNRTDELRMLGNGVVPGTAERAFIELWRQT